MSLIPVLGTEVPRIIAFIPLLSVLVLWPNLTKENYRFQKTDKSIFLFIFLFIIFALLHSFFISVSPDAMGRLEKITPLLLGGGLFLYLIQRTPDFNHEKFYKIIMAICGLSALLIVFELTQGEPLYRLIREIEAGAPVNPAVFNRGAVIIVTVFLTAFFMCQNKKTIFTFLSLLPLLALFTVIESQSAQLGFFFGLAFYFLFPFKYKFFWYALYTSICVYILAFPFIMPELFKAIPAEVFQNGFLQSSFAADRLEIWEFVSRQILQNPWVGHGLEFSRGHRFDIQNIYFLHDAILHPHNAILQLWIELGLIGILFLKALVGLFLVYLYKSPSVLIKRAGVTMLLTLLLLNSFSYGLWQAWWIGLMFVIIGLILLVSQKLNVIKNT